MILKQYLQLTGRYYVYRLTSKGSKRLTWNITWHRYHSMVQTCSLGRYVFKWTLHWIKMIANSRVAYITIQNIQGLFNEINSSSQCSFDSYNSFRISILLDVCISWSTLNQYFATINITLSVAGSRWKSNQNKATWQLFVNTKSPPDTAVWTLGGRLIYVSGLPAWVAFLFTVIPETVLSPCWYRL